MFMERFISMLPGQKLIVLDEFSGTKTYASGHLLIAVGSELEGLLYEHPIRGDSFYMPFLPASHVVETVGTGLVHCAPCHGREDFEVGCKFSLPLVSYLNNQSHNGFNANSAEILVIFYFPCQKKFGANDLNAKKERTTFSHLRIGQMFHQFCFLSVDII